MDYCSTAGYPFVDSNVAVQTTTQTDGSLNVVTATRSSVVVATAISTNSQPSSTGTSTSFPAVVGLLTALLWLAVVMFEAEIRKVLPSSDPVSSSLSPTATGWINKLSTSWTTETPTGTTTANTGGRQGSYSTSDKIALGVGIGIGLSAALLGFVVCWWTMIRRV
jgi:hypothetical protein